MILIAFTGWKMITTSKSGPISNIFTKATVTLGIAMAVLYLSIF